ncbi:AraC family transcriptional regulator [Pseudoalteromonas sp.]|uniref:helix-turn-helix domain-containing protein n=1 Tax=Pseudoalteromonas sp. TaxID=53249 RepID=UPI00235609A3|nr:AraC family transcriptional regulator [Pseudoalteromonas sp.]
MLLISIAFQYLHVIGTFQGVLLACMLMLGQGITNAGRILGIWCLFMAFYFCSPLVIIHSDDTIFANLVGWGYFIPASFGAFLYLYCRSAIIDKPFHLYDFLHCIPFLLCLLLNIDFLLMSPSDKIDLVNIGHQRGEVLITQLLMGFQAFIYLGLSAHLIMKFKRQADDTLSNFNPKIFTWLWVLLGMYGVIWLLDLLGSILEGNYVLTIVSDILFISLIYSISLYQWREPKLFKIKELSAVSNNEILKPKSELFDHETGKMLLSNILGYMNNKKPYLDNELTLDSLAKLTDLSSHHLSEILNQQAKKNFYQFVNEYRVNFICERIAVERNSKILDLALDAGFSSKSTFNAVFKKLKGITPTQYRNQLNTKH